ncbi:ATP-binding protein [Dictyobacter kobayashii]|uniref:Uncharacterized protein n=1 Tax=Dictyobacter kobayashii TaxID=2014872 RepID=A0A402AUH2_9CHLR|nr:tetratricopeptide repeat protein [Dictyobacter kobayashii]GCE22768.1 hypothetical protein KDK_65680 [Dictyobacter kobayashii]
MLEPGAKNLSLTMLLTPCIGRESEIDAAGTMLKRDDVRLLTLIGAGGVGKTRLALAIAQHMQHLFCDDCAYIFLDSIREPDEVIQALCQQLNIHAVERQQLLETLKAALKEKRMLLLLDNFEQVSSAAPLLLELLIACPQLKFLVTSRVTLHVRGAYELYISPLSLPDIQANYAPAELVQSASVRLFVQRVQTFQPDFQLNKINAAYVAKICVHLDGLPLALELAAARLRLFSPQALLERLEKRLPLLTNGSHDLPPRQKTLRDTLSWSYTLLDWQEQHLFRLLAVFQGGFTVEAAEQVCGAGQGIADLLTLLLEKSLLQQKESNNGERRLLMLETVREYAWECLTQHSAEEELACRAHANYYLTWVEMLESEREHMLSSVWYRCLTQELANVRAAWRWTIEQHETELTLRFGGALRAFWMADGSWLYEKEYHVLSQILLQRDAASVIPVLIWARALATAGILAFYQHAYDRCISFHEESLLLYRQQGDSLGAATVLNELGKMARLHGRRSEALTFLQESLSLYRAVGDRPGCARALLLLADVFSSQFQPDEALPLIRESFALCWELDDMRGCAAALNLQAQVFDVQGEPEQAQLLAEESLELYRGVGDAWELGNGFLEVARFALVRGEYTLAYQQAAEGLTITRETRNQEGSAWALCLMGHARLYQNEAVAGMGLLQESLKCYKELGNSKGVALLLQTFARLSFERRDYAQAQTYTEESLSVFIERDSRFAIVYGLEFLGKIVMAQGQPEWATLLLAAAQQHVRRLIFLRHQRTNLYTSS